jgi:acyl-CoA dehydrogenase
LPGPADPFDTAERRALADAVQRFTAVHIVPELAAWEDAGELPRQLHHRAAEAGLLGVGYPEAVGGEGGDAIDQLVVTEALLAAGGSGGVVAGLFTHGIALPHVIDAAAARRAAGDTAGAEHLEQRYVRPVLRGEAICALAVTEPDGGSDVANLRTAGRWQDGRLRVSGSKTTITSGARADFVVAAVRTGGPGAAGVSLVLVDADTPGFTVTRRLAKMGWHCSDTAELGFSDVPVPAEHILGEGAGFAGLARHFVTERLSLAVTGYATGQRCLDLAAAWAKDRTTFGRPLAQRQVIRHTLVEMHRRIDVARRYTRWVAARHAAGESVVAEAVLAKQTGAEAGEFAADRAVQVFGGMGYLRDSEVERHYRDVRILGIGGGATEVMTDLAARLLDF